jgi:hypothetical protein
MGITEDYARELGITLDEATLDISDYEALALKDIDPMTGEAFDAYYPEDWEYDDES